jgi:hypothetical protein
MLKNKKMRIKPREGITMRRVYVIDLGLIFAAGTLAVALMAKPDSSLVSQALPEREAAILSKAAFAVGEALRPADQRETHGETISEPDR